jgi:hypothetical protein
LEDDPFVSLAADAIRFGMDRADFMDRNSDDFLVNLAIMKKISKDRAEEKKTELEALAKMIAAELLPIMGAVFR